jgi:hypothetical protein
MLTSCSSTEPDIPTADPGDPDAAVGKWHSVFDDLDSLVLAGWAADADDAFFVGDDGLVLRYQQAHWYQLEVPTRATLWWVWGTSGSNVYVAGEQGTLLHFDGQKWTSIDTALSDAQTIWGIWGASENDVWLVGGNAQTNGPGFLLRGDGTHFELQDIGELPNLFKVWGPSLDEVYAVGDRGTMIQFGSQPGGEPHIQHLDPDADGGAVETLFTVAGNRSGSVVAVGGVSQGMLFEKQGVLWESADLQTRGLNGVVVMESGDAYAVGLGGTIRHRNNGQWLTEDYALERDYHSAVLMGEVVFAVGGDLFAPKAERRGLVVARGTVSAGTITRIPGNDGGIVKGDLGDGAAPLFDAAPPDGGYFDLDGGNEAANDGGAELSIDSGIVDASADSGPPLSGPAEPCTADLDCATGTECWFIQGETEDRCVTPCTTPDECPAEYGINPQCASPGCQTLYTVCMPETWVGCL